MIYCTRGHISEALYPVLSAFDGGSRIAGDGDRIKVGFSEVNVDAPTVFTLSQVNLRPCVVDTLEPKHLKCPLF
jgi:hypothetical protein